MQKKPLKIHGQDKSHPHIFSNHINGWMPFVQTYAKSLGLKISVNPIRTESFFYGTTIHRVKCIGSISELINVYQFFINSSNRIEDFVHRYMYETCLEAIRSTVQIRR